VHSHSRYTAAKVFQEAAGRSTRPLGLVGGGGGGRGGDDTLREFVILDVTTLYRELQRGLETPVGQELLATIASGCVSGQSETALRLLFVNDCLKRATLENSQQRALGNATHCAQAWKQCATLATLVAARSLPGSEGGQQQQQRSGDGNASDDGESRYSSSSSAVAVAPPPAASVPNAVLTDLAEALMLPLASYMHAPSSSPGLSNTLRQTDSNIKVVSNTIPHTRDPRIRPENRTQNNLELATAYRMSHMSCVTCQCLLAAAIPVIPHPHPNRNPPRYPSPSPGKTDPSHPGGDC